MGLIFGVLDDTCSETKTGASNLMDESEEAKLQSGIKSDAMLFMDEPEEAKLHRGSKSDAMPFTDEPEVAKMQLVWLEQTDLLNGTRSSNFSFNSLTS